MNSIRINFFESVVIFVISNILGILLYAFFVNFLEKEYIVLYVFMQNVFLLFFCVFWLFRCGENKKIFLKQFFKKIGFYELKLSFKYFLFVVLTLVLILFIIFFLMKFFDIKISGTFHKFDKFTYSWEFFVFVIVYIGLGPLAEEVFFRVVLFNSLRNELNFWFSMLISSFIFAILHSGIGHFFFAFVSGCFLSYVYEKYKNIPVIVLIHSLLNIPAVIYVILSSINIFKY